MELGSEIAGSIRQDLKSMRLIKAIKQCCAIVVGGVAYMPVSSWVKPARGFYSQQSLNQMIGNVGLGKYAIDEDKAYQDYVVSGIK